LLRYRDVQAISAKSLEYWRHAEGVSNIQTVLCHHCVHKKRVIPAIVCMSCHTIDSTPHLQREPEPHILIWDLVPLVQSFPLGLAHLGHKLITRSIGTLEAHALNEDEDHC